MKTNNALAVVLMVAGDGIGVIVALRQGITSWLDAKLYLMAGAFTGAGVAFCLRGFVSNGTD